MEQNSNNFSMQEIMRLANSPAGQQLIQLLKQKNNQQMQQAVTQFQAGDRESAKQALSQILNDPKAKELLQQLGK